MRKRCEGRSQRQLLPTRLRVGQELKGPTTVCCTYNLTHLDGVVWCIIETKRTRQAEIERRQGRQQGCWCWNGMVEMGNEADWQKAPGKTT